MMRFSVLVLLAGSIALGPDVFAQEAPEPGSAAAEATVAEVRRVPRGLEEITVTARKKGNVERLQEVPITITAITESYLENNFVEDLIQVGRNAPNVQLSNGGTYANTAMFSIRGSAIFSSIPSTEPVVGLFVDGVYTSLNMGAINDLFEVQSIEIMRGPQGTLFGRNVTGGAVQVRHRRPSGEFGFRGKATIGSFSRSDFAASVEGPISETLAWKIDVLTKDRNGMLETPNVPGGGRQGHSRSWTARAMLNWHPTDAFRVDFLWEEQEYNGDGHFNRTRGPIGISSTGAFGPPPANTVGKQGEWDLQISTRGDQGYGITRTVLEINWDVGPGTLTAITGYRDTEANTAIDVDGHALNLFESQAGGVTRPSSDLQWQVSQELRYAVALGERADATFGAYYFKQDLDYKETRPLFMQFWDGVTPFSELLGSPEAPKLAPPWIVPARGELDHQVISFFGQGDYSLTDTVTLTGGLRWTWEEKVAVADPLSTGAALCDIEFLRCRQTFQDQDTWDFVSSHLGVRWQATEDLLLYGTFNRSFRSGGFNLRSFVEFGPGPYGDERVDAWEVGMKGDWLDSTLRTNVSGFYNRRTDKQTTVLIGVQQDVRNDATMHLAGVEAEVLWAPITGLTIATSGGWIDAEYDNFGSLFEARGITAGQGRALDVAYVPEWTANANVRYETPAPSILGKRFGGLLGFQVSMAYKDKTALNDANDFYADRYTLWDGAISYTSDDGRYTVSFFGKNLTNEPAHDFGLFSVGIGTLSEWAVRPPRTYGAEISFRY